MYTPAVVEFLGTSLLLSAIAFTGNPSFIAAAFAIALGLGAKISGGHYNPAVTAWAFASGKIGQQKAVTYMLAQFGASLFILILASFIKL